MKRWNIYCNFILRNLDNKGYENAQLPKIVSNKPELKTNTYRDNEK